MSQFVDPTRKYPVTGLLQRLAGTDENGNPVVETYQVIDQIVEENRYLRDYHPRGGYNPSRTRRRVAQIPMVIVEQLIQRFGKDWWRWDENPEFTKWLNSAEAAPWRTSPGSV